MKQQIQCPYCNFVITVSGKPGKKIKAKCPQCKNKGQFIFPEKHIQIVESDRSINEEKDEKRLYSKNLKKENLETSINQIETYAIGLRKNIKDYNGHFANIIQYAPDFYELYESMLKENKFSDDVRFLINSIVAYFVLADDIIPEDKLGPFGYIDDLYISVYALKKLNSEKKTIKDHWKRKEDVFELATHILDEIENSSDTILEKYRLSVALDYIKPILLILESKENKDTKLKKQEDKKIPDKPVERMKTAEKNIYWYDPTLYYVEEKGRTIELVNKETGFTCLTLDNNYHAFKPEKDNIRQSINFKEIDNIEKVWHEGNYAKQKINNNSSIKTKKNNVISPEEVIKKITINEARQLKEKIKNIISSLREQIENSDINNHDISKVVMKEKCHGLSRILDIYINDNDFSAFPKIKVLREKIGPLYAKASDRIIGDLIQIYPSLNKYVKVGFIDLGRQKLKMLEYKYREEVLEEKLPFEKNNDTKKKIMSKNQEDIDIKELPLIRDSLHNGLNPCQRTDS